MPNRLEAEPVPRRDFLGLAGLWTAGVAILGSLLGMLRLPNPRVLPEQSSRFSIGHPEEFAAGSKRILPGRNVEVVSTEQGIAAVSLVCTHLGCIVAPTPEGYSCPCHGSRFGLAGEVRGGPAPRGLPWLELSRAPDGSLVVDGKREVPPHTYFRG